MKKRNLRVKNNWKFIDLAVFLLLLTVTIVMTKDYLNEGIQSFANGEISLSGLVSIILVSSIMVMPFSIPFIAIYLVIRFNSKKHAYKNATFEVVNDIEYYRNNFGEISPALISLMVNLDIEEKKDITAMLLYYKLNNIIKISNNEIIINENVSLKESDKIFIKWLKSKNILYLDEWKNQIKQDGIEQGYIQKQKDKNKGCLTPIICLVVTIVATIIDWSLLSRTVENDSGDIKIVFLFVILIGLFFLIINWLWIGLAYFFSEMANKKNIKRTRKGNELTEKIYAMKNFIHDFGNLSTVTKESLCMWEYFLIYAIVLEENKTILDEIKGYYDVDSYKILLLEENLVDKNVNTW